MDIVFEDVFERDIDLLLMNIFTFSEKTVEKFVEELGIEDNSGFRVEALEHSHTDDTGESDITVILKLKSGKHGILIENKIDAPAQDRQAIRYQERGNNGIKEGRYDSFSVVLIAPERYLQADRQDYKNKISYERLIELISESDIINKDYALALLERAISKQKQGYTMKAHQGATDFYKDYIACWKQNEFYKCANMTTKDGREHPKAGGWVEFSTGIDGLSITHKSKDGFIDLTFNSCKDMGAEIQNLLKEATDDIEKYMILNTGKSASVRIIKRPLDISRGLAEQEDYALDAMRAVTKLSTLANNMNRKKVEDLIKRARENQK